MNERRQRLLWFAALYLGGLIAFLLATSLIKCGLKLLK